MSEPVPESWKQRVREILQAGDIKQIIVTARAGIEWSAMFPQLYNCDLWDALAEALKNPDLRGRRVIDMEESGEIYAFIFIFKRKDIYTKINLRPDGKIIIIYSAHRPLKGDQP